jgi:hypothetical protein
LLQDDSVLWRNVDLRECKEFGRSCGLLCLCLLACVCSDEE